MLKTVYSNAYEILEAYLTAELTEDKKTGANPFDRIRVISSSGAINNRLRQHIAQSSGICSGVDFWTTASWFHNYVGIGVGDPEEAQDFLWVIWSVLTDEFIAKHPRLATFFSHRESTAEKALARYELAGKIASVFDKYVNYRFDWVARWMGFTQVKAQTLYQGVDEKLLAKEEKALTAHPDYEWQKAIWEKLSQTTVWAGRETLKLYANPESLKIKFDNEPETLHFFAPMGISPLMLPVIKLLSEHGHKVYVYLLNPCVEYWFDSFADTNKKTESALDYLRKNAASTRAMINRFWTFTPEGRQNSDHEPQKLPDLTQAPLQKLDIWTHGETERLDLVQDRDTLLHRAQNALLQNTSDILPDAVAEDDRTIRLIKAPTLTREVQNAINMIQAFFSEKDLNLKPEDVLLVTPEIDKTAPVFEACMQALSADCRIDYQIFGRSGSPSLMAARALVDLGKLLMDGITLDRLNAWLELPIAAQSLGLTLDDLNILHDWLRTAGFRAGLNDRHFKATHPEANDALLTEASDGTLERAIERLSWGYVLDEGTDACPCDILPVEHGSNRFNTLSENQPLFLTLCLLYEKFNTAFEEMQKLGDEALPANLSLWAHGLVEAFFAQHTDKVSLMSLRNDLRVQEIALTTVPEPITMPLSVFWRAFEDKISEPADRNPAVGRITLAPMNTFRGLPFKVIFAIGMGEESGFPGNQRFEEFDLMGSDELKRQNDRDSRSDNRNVFLDLFLAARERFVCSYTIGSNKKAPKNASPVVVDLFDFLTQNAKQEAEKTAIEAKERMIAALSAEISLTDTDISNFVAPKPRYWKSFMKGALEALEVARESGYQNEEPLALTGPLVLADADLKPLYIEEILAFYKDPTKWLQDKLNFKAPAQSEDDEVPLIGTQDRLEVALFKREALKMYEAGMSREDVLQKIALDPTKGTQTSRVLRYENLAASVEEAFRMKEEIIESARGETANYRKALADSAPYNELIAEAITGYYFDDLKKEDDHWSSVIEKDKPYLIEICTSGSSVKQAIVKAALLSFMGMSADLILIDFEADEPLKVLMMPDAQFCGIFTQSIISLMIETLNDPGLISQGWDEDVQKIFMRGRDLDETQSLTKAFFSRADDLIAPLNLYPPKKSRKTDRQKKLENFENSLDDLRGAAS